MKAKASRLISQVLDLSELPLWLRLIFATLLVALSCAVRMPAWPVMENTIPFATFFPAVIVAAFLFGVVPALWATLLSLVVSWYVLLPPVMGWGVAPIYGVISVIFFLFVAVVDIVLIEMVKSGYRDQRSLRQQAEASEARAELLSRELDHRIRNMFAVTGAIVSAVGRRGDPDSRPLFDDLRRRIDALGRAHSISLGSGEVARSEIRALIEAVFEPYADAARFEIDGGDIALSREQATPLGLILHELTTNAVKHGALSVEKGKIRVAVNRRADEIVLDWEERSPRQEPVELLPSGGLGSLIIDIGTRQLEGRLSRCLDADGLQVTLTFPLGD